MEQDPAASAAPAQEGQNSEAGIGEDQPASSGSSLETQCRSVGLPALIRASSRELCDFAVQRFLKVARIGHHLMEALGQGGCHRGRTE